MGIGEKKSVLRHMYQNAAAAETAPAESAAERSARLESRFDHVFVGVIHVGLYVLFLLGAGLFAAILHAHYAAGEAFEQARVNRYIRDGFWMIAGSLALIVLGLLVFLWFRKRLPRRTRWIALGCLVSLFPGAIVSICFLSTCHEAGRRQAFARIDAVQLLEDAREIQRTFPLTDSRPREAGTIDFATTPLPRYVEDHLHPVRARIYPGGVLIGLDGAGDFEGLIVATDRVSEAQAEKIARGNDFELLSKSPPVFRFKTDNPDTTFMEARGVPSTLPAYGNRYWY